MIRLLDLAICLAALVVALVLAIPCAIIKFIVDGAPLFYVSQRVGLNGKVFSVYKFRTMVRDREFIAAEIARLGRTGFEVIPVDSPVYTKLGAIFEQWQLVELPQLINVLIGDMSLVGYRPLPQTHVAALEAQLGSHAMVLRHTVKPGITGLTQLIGKNTLTNEQRLKIEIMLGMFMSSPGHSVDKILVYLLILLNTVTVVLFSNAVYFDFVLDRIDRLEEDWRDSGPVMAEPLINLVRERT
jgi:lipopolysaccharide/colanic/teichoic acid biosynthesis glycosyltransferase